MQCAYAILSSVACPAVPCFYALSQKTARLSKKKELLKVKCVFQFSLQFCLNYFSFSEELSEI